MNIMQSISKDSLFTNYRFPNRRTTPFTQNLSPIDLSDVANFASVAGPTANKILERVNSHISRPNLNLGQQNILAQLVSLFSRRWLHHGLSTLQVLNLSSLNKHIVKVSLTGFSVHLLLIPPSLVQHVHFSLLGHVVNCSPEYCYRFSFSSQSMTTTLRWTFRLQEGEGRN